MRAVRPWEWRNERAFLAACDELVTEGIATWVSEPLEPVDPAELFGLVQPLEPKRDERREERLEPLQLALELAGE